MNMLPIKSLVPEELRSGIRAQIAAHPNPVAAAAADEIADLVLLAATDAVSAIDRVASSASNYGTALAVLSGSTSTIRAILDRLESGLLSYAAAEGAHVFHAKVNIGGGGR